MALYIKTIPRTLSNIEYGGQVARSSGSVGANYIEANEALSKRDFALRIKISRKESEESAYWLRLIVETNEDGCAERGKQLMQEATELKKIFPAIIEKMQ